MEIFREIPSLPGYRASDQGRIKGRSGKMLKQRDQAGYRYLIIDIAGKSTKFYAHALVCEAFHGPRPAGKEVAHENGQRADNRANNLSWKTRAENHADKRGHGTHRQGEDISWAKLTEDDVREIRRHPEKSTVALGRHFNVNPAAVWLIRAGRNWKHVQ